MKAIRYHRYGGPEVLQLEEIPVPSPKPGEALVKVRFAGVNYVDVYQRSGLSPTGLPWTAGVEAVGTLTDDIGGLRAGTRVGWPTHPGAYAEFAAVPLSKLVAIPDAITDQVAVASLMQALTAQYLTESTYPVKAGDRVLVHAGAGGVGLLLLQVLRSKRAYVIATVSTSEKAVLARQAGADEVIVCANGGFAAAVTAATQGRGLHVVYDSVGQATFHESLACLQPLGMLVSFGHSSGPVPPIDPLVLAKGGSLFLTRPTLGHYIVGAEALAVRTARVWGWLSNGTLQASLHGVYPLAEAGRAHAAIESRRTSGKLLLEIAS